MSVVVLSSPPKEKGSLIFVVRLMKIAGNTCEYGGIGTSSCLNRLFISNLLSIIKFSSVSFVTYILKSFTE